MILLFVLVFAFVLVFVLVSVVVFWYYVYVETGDRNGDLIFANLQSLSLGDASDRQKPWASW